MQSITSWNLNFAELDIKENAIIIFHSLQSKSKFYFTLLTHSTHTSQTWMQVTFFSHIFTILSFEWQMTAGQKIIKFYDIRLPSRTEAKPPPPDTARWCRKNDGHLVDTEQGGGRKIQRICKDEGLCEREKKIPPRAICEDDVGTLTMREPWPLPFLHMSKRNSHISSTGSQSAMPVK